MVNLLKIFRNPSAKNGGIFCLRTLFSSFLFFIVVASYAQPKVLITEAKKNFGFVKRGAIIKNEFEVTNVGNAPLLLSGVEIACSCTTADFPKNPVLAGQKIIVTVIFNTTTVYGRQDRIVYLNSNDPSGPHKLRYKGTVSKN